MPAVTSPPGELMYKVMSFLAFCDSRNNNCAVNTELTRSSIAPSSIMIRSLSNLEKMSYDLSPLLVCSITIGVSGMSKVY